MTRAAVRGARIDGVKVFTASIADDRNALGERVTAWLRENPRCDVHDARVLQSSDERRHCVSIVLFYRVDAAPAEATGDTKVGAAPREA